MPKLGERAYNFKPSAVSEIAGKIRELQHSGKDAISFSLGVPNFDPPQHVFDAAHTAVDAHVGRSYENPQGTREVVQAFQKRLKADGFEYSEEEICVAVGGKNALFNLFLLILDKGDKVAHPAPYWASYKGIVNLAGGENIEMSCPKEQDYKLQPQQLEVALKQGAKIFLFNNPANPTGMVYSREEIAALGDVLVKYPDVWVISDDIYDKLIYDGEKFHHLLHTHPELRDRTLIINSISKAYGMPGWRVGMVAGPAEMTKLLGKINSQTMMNVTAISMKVAAVAFSGPQEFIEEKVSQLQEKRDLTMQALASIDGVECPFPQGAFYAFPDISNYFGKSFRGTPVPDAKTLCDIMLEHYLIGCVPGCAFGEPKALRISFACETNVLKEGLRRMCEFFNELK